MHLVFCSDLLGFSDQKTSFGAMGRFKTSASKVLYLALVFWHDCILRSRVCSLSGQFVPKFGEVDLRTRALEGSRACVQLQIPNRPNPATPSTCEQCLASRLWISNLGFRRMSAFSLGDNNKSCRDSHKSADCHLRHWRSVLTQWFQSQQQQQQP